MNWIILYGRGKPGARLEELNGKTYRQAFQYAADHAHGWGFTIKRETDLEQIEIDDSLNSPELIDE